jgi:hypothetical protein
MQSYGDFRHKKQKKMISGRDAYGAYTRFATDTANLAITVAKDMKKFYE